MLDAFAAGYAAMSRFLLFPADRELLDLLSDRDLLGAWPMPGDPDTCRGLESLAASIAVTEGEPALRLDYDRLFVGPTPLLAAPYESVHLTVERLLFDRPALEVRAAYRAFGMQAARMYREPDDHLGLEFSFLALVCRRAADGLEHGNQTAVDTALLAQREFLSGHVLRWAGDCLTAVERSADTAFYRGVAAVGLGVLGHARVWLE